MTDQIIMGQETEVRAANVLAQREHTALRKAGFNPEVVKVVPKETSRASGQTRPDAPPDIISFPAKGSGARARAADGEFAKEVSPRAALDAALAKHSGRAAEEALAAQGEKGQDQNTKAEDPAAKTDAATDAKEADPKAAKALQDARTALKLAGGYDESDLEGLSEEKILALGRKAAVRNAEVSKRLERDAKAAKEPTADAKAAEAAHDADPTDDCIAQAAKGFSEKYEGEFGQEIAEFGRAIAKTEGAKVAALQAQMQTYRTQVEAVLKKDAVSGLRELFPQLDQPENLTKFSAAWDADEPNDGEDHAAFGERIALSLFGKQALQAAKDMAKAKSEAKRDGQPVSAKRDASARPKTPQEVFDAKLKAAMQGSTREDLRAIG